MALIEVVTNISNFRICFTKPYIKQEITTLIIILVDLVIFFNKKLENKLYLNLLIFLEKLYKLIINGQLF